MPDEELNTVVTGVTFKGSVALAAVAALKVGDPLKLYREPQNRHDANAICVAAFEVAIGYIPKVCNSRLAAAMDRAPRSRRSSPRRPTPRRKSPRSSSSGGGGDVAQDPRRLVRPVGTACHRRRLLLEKTPPLLSGHPVAARRMTRSLPAADRLVYGRSLISRPQPIFAPRRPPLPLTPLIAGLAIVAMLAVWSVT